MEQNWDDTQRSFDCPLTDEQLSIVIFYIRNYGRTFSPDEFRARCISEAEAGRGLDTIRELAAIDADLTSDTSTLMMKSLLLERTATWREIRSADPLDQYGRRNIFLDFPLDEWIEDAYTYMEALKTLVKNCVETVERRILKNLQPVQEPMLESDLTSLALVLWNFRQFFVSDVQLVARVFRNGRGTIAVRIEKKIGAAMFLEAIRIGLGILNPSDYMNIQIIHALHDAAMKEAVPESWYTHKNVLADRANTKRSKDQPNFSQYVTLAKEILHAVTPLKDKRNQW
ncbi:MAG: hypothetical protein IPP80_10380 [Ignavibacteria bacterium]|nr:hypothetical protein [Ignavibacteria bacterium]